jgi:sulfoxide reductase heme-binding subunit YedZ
MVTLLLAALALILVGEAAVISVFALDGEPALAGWIIATLGTLGLTAAALGHAVNPADMFTLSGVVLFAGIAGAGWSPRGKGVWLFLASAALMAGLLARFIGLSDVLASGMAAMGNLPWMLSRASGFVAFAAATGALVLGARRPSRLPLGGTPARLYALHRALGVAALLALVVHLISLWLDTFVDFNWAQLLALPWTSDYRPFALTLGWLAAMSLLLTAASAALRRRLSGWRIVHLLAYATFGLGLFHGLLAGTDSSSLVARSFYVGAFLLVAVAWLRRIYVELRAEWSKQSQIVRSVPARANLKGSHSR